MDEPVQTNALGLQPKESAYYQCIQKNAYQTVQPGEACTIDIAKKMGVYDPEKYFKPGYETVRLFNETDDVENRTDQVCNENTLTGKEAYPVCAAAHGFGFVRKMPGTCIAFDCPPGFVKEGTNCVKPKVNASMPKQSRCDERWHDWYTVPNYHLGNGHVYASASTKPKDGTMAKPAKGREASDTNGAADGAAGGEGGKMKCYAPCGAYHVPYLTSDPVDNAGIDFTSQSKQDRCVSRALYFAGKYADGSDHCPIAWVHRIGMTPSLVQRKLHDLYERLEKDGIPNEELSKLRATINTTAKSVATESANKLEGLSKLTPEMARACNTLNTKERVKDAYQICSIVQQDPDELTRRFYEDLQDNESKQTKKITQLQQACHLLFCDENTSEALDIIGQDPICFPDSLALDDKYFEEDEDAAIDTNSKMGPVVDPMTEEKKRLQKMARMSVMLVLIVVIVMVSYYMFVRFIWPKVLRPIVYLILRVVFGVRRYRPPEQSA